MADLLPMLDNGLLDPALCGLTWSFFKQTVVKQLLTEGERYVMTFFDAVSFADQGVYDVVNNLGSLVVRFVFNPIEESSNVFFSRTLQRGATSAKMKNQSREDAENSTFATEVLRNLLRLMTHLGLLALVFGQAYSHLALDLLGGKTLSEGFGPSLLRMFCLYVLVIAWNGTLEAFATAVMTEEQVDVYSQFMVAFSAAFIAATLILTRVFGPYGFIIANCFNMALRIWYCASFVRQFHEDGNWSILTAMPSRISLGFYAIAFVFTKASELLLCPLLRQVLPASHATFTTALIICSHLGIGALMLGLTLIVVVRDERALVAFVKRQWKDRKQKAA